MYGENVKASEGLTFTFEGDMEVDALSVSKAIESLVSVSTAIAENNYPDVEFRLAVRALSPGSLNFVFVAAAQAMQTLLTTDGIQYVKGLMDIVKASFEIKKFLNGNTPAHTTKAGDRIEIERPDGTKLSVPKGAGVYFIDQRIDKSISNIFSNALNSPGISGVKLTKEDGESVEIASEEFRACSLEIPTTESSQPKTMTVERQREILFVRTPDLLGGTQWGFKTDKNIKADIEDKVFLESIQSGDIPIFAKMYIIADIRLTMEIGSDGLPDESKCHYAVTKVHSVHQPGENQTDMFDDQG